MRRASGGIRSERALQMAHPDELRAHCHNRPWPPLRTRFVSNYTLRTFLNLFVEKRSIPAIADSLKSDDRD